MSLNICSSRPLIIACALGLAACAALSALTPIAGAGDDDGPVRLFQNPAPSQTPAAPAQPAAPTQPTSPAPAPPPEPVVPALLTSEDVAKLRWIEGSWRGTGDIEKPFYERYRVEDNAVIVEGFEDETFSSSTGASRFELQDGEMGGGNEGWRWVVTSLDDNSVTFGPVIKARNTFRWECVSADEWRAVLEWPAAGDRPARRRVYKMERWPPPAGRNN